MPLYFYAPGDTVPGDDPVELPKNWMNVSSLDALEPMDLAALGWKPAVDEIPKFDVYAETCRRAGWVVHKDRVTAKYEVEDKPLDQVKREAKARVAARRYAAEVGGIGVDGGIIDTSREAQAKLTGAHLLVSRDPEQAIDWKTVDGWIQLKPERVLELAAMVSLHVQVCYSRERMICEVIDAAESPAAVRRAEVW
jgi:hypothetical protein